MKGQVRIRSKSEQARGTHLLESAEGDVRTRSRIMQASKGHSLPEEHRSG
jgi:hypothetical protein